MCLDYHSVTSEPTKQLQIYKVPLTSWDTDILLNVSKVVFNELLVLLDKNSEKKKIEIKMTFSKMLFNIQFAIEIKLNILSINNIINDNLFLNY